MKTLLLLTFFGFRHRPFQRIIPDTANAGSEWEMVYLVRSVEIPRRKRLYVMYVNVVNAEAFSGSYVEAATDPVHF